MAAVRAPSSRASLMSWSPDCRLKMARSCATPTTLSKLRESSRNFLGTRPLLAYAATGRPNSPISNRWKSTYVSIVVPLLDAQQVAGLPGRAREVIEYRKSGLSLNHIQGCPLDCAYCIRHTYGLWDQRQPRALMPDAEAAEQLVSHRYFQAHVTPLQLFNRATDPFLPAVRPHTFAVLEDLDRRQLRNHVLVITRHRLKPSDAERL